MEGSCGVSCDKKAVLLQRRMCDALTKVNKQPAATPPPKISHTSI